MSEQQHISLFTHPTMQNV